MTESAASSFTTDAAAKCQSCSSELADPTSLPCPHTLCIACCSSAERVAPSEVCHVCRDLEQAGRPEKVVVVEAAATASANNNNNNNQPAAGGSDGKSNDNGSSRDDDIYTKLCRETLESDIELVTMHEVDLVETSKLLEAKLTQFVEDIHDVEETLAKNATDLKRRVDMTLTQLMKVY